ncbi:hypothetical protein EFA46_008790 [Halarchaeum sp. CBA1220]|uniref:hypothetical protein n=1 Tax=Halarchaeum sp. CBA1220 TaxID=1853682 RepID=UPI000F3A8F4B|nr:hypothetical protein [Halarchaeum sp. CBA1220]QLC34297.1 hypothetical protein EFA46_008790 [Halarchaeum sp. CBA1220]
MRTRALTLVLLLVCASVAGVGVGAETAQASHTSTITQTTTLSLTPETAGEITATVRYDLPESVTALSVTVPSSQRVAATSGFAHTSGNSYEWDGETESPSLMLRVPANRTFTGNRALDTARARDGGVTVTGPHSARTEGVSSASASDAMAATTGRDGGARSRTADTADGAASDGGEYSFVDTGSWAITPIPQFGTHWSWRGTEHVGLERRTAVDGPGVAGNAMAYLGPHETYERRAHGQRLRLVVPAAASLRESPESVLDALADASGAMTGGARDAEVRVVAAPTSVNWGPSGLEYGGSDAWVRADSRLDAPENVWLHEYVHTRQAYTPTNETKWTLEGGAEYYAGLLTLQQGRITYEEFRSYLTRGRRDPYAGAVLAEPTTWRGLADYLKGALVVGTLDRRIRTATAGEHSFDAVLAQLNSDDDRVTQAEFLAAVAAAGDDATRDAAARYTETDAVPETWSYAAHERAFGESPPRMAFALDGDALAAHGPWRNATLDVATGATTLATGEALVLNATVTNHGEHAGEYEATLRRNGTVVAETGGRLDGGASTRVTLDATLTEADDYVLDLGYREIDVEVVRPATPVVRSLSVNRSAVNASQPVEVTVEVANPSSHPANATYAITVDGRQTGTWTPYLAPNESVTGTFTVTFESGGTHTVRVGERNATVEVSGGGLVPGVPGFGPVTGALGVLLGIALAVAARRQHRE